MHYYIHIELYTYDKLENNALGEVGKMCNYLEGLQLVRDIKDC